MSASLGDGASYVGRVDLTGEHTGGYDLLAHMRQFAWFHSGRPGPEPHPDRDPYLTDRVSPEQQADYGRLLDVYLVEGAQP